LGAENEKENEIRSAPKTDCYLRNHCVTGTLT